MYHLLITGDPGIGKTTLIKKIIGVLKSKNVDFDGFYTEEIRDDNNYRVGFEIVTIDGKRGILAKKGWSNLSSFKPKVGQYTVHTNEFEQLILPILEKPKKLLIIDEIGKMELLSKKFEESVSNIFFDNTAAVIATVPLKDQFFVRQLKERKDCHLITMTHSNRNAILEEIKDWLNGNKKLKLFL
ncbi:nucleoside-triphosphatase THEP1 [Diorhabda sublineata]|uniref:nucleoside-triphosphatase THEP1 n=1 Tax=Diorhabda sublineata TaxID=1163346 RepID=UPI0024E0F0FB|nr:nucleoside-triphosphatase THEP1 [Diorhabda sublineata]